MAGKAREQVVQRVLEAYQAKTTTSAAHHAAACRHLPRGDTRTSLYFEPHPVYMERGQGCRLFDGDGNEYLDFLSNYTSLIHGHAHPEITAAAAAQLSKGAIFGAPSEIQYRHAEHLRQRMPSLDLIRYCNSGTEATMFALRGARAFTGRDVVMKMDGSYLGTHDVAEVNLTPDVEAQGLPSKRVGPGVPGGAVGDVVIAPFNDLEAVEVLMKRDRHRLAAVIVEPIMAAAGLITPSPGYLRGLRELADRYEVVLIFDEVVTLRLDWGGMQALSGVRPDMTTLGKLIGGGLPVGAFGGRADIMAVFDPRHSPAVIHGGTFNGHNVAMAAGLVALKLFDQAAADRINELGERLRAGFKAAAAAAELKLQVSGQGSLLNVHWGASEPKNAREAALMKNAAGDLVRLFHLEMLNQGIYVAPRCMFIISTPMTEKEIDAAVAAFEKSLETLKPLVVEDLPHLLAD